MPQNFNLVVPHTNSSLTCGGGPVDGVSITTAENKFVHAGVEMVLESGSHMRLASMGLLSEAGQGGVLIATPATIQATAGGGVQIYAGAGAAPSIGGPDGPGDPFAASKPAKINAGKFADSMNAFNDKVKALGDIAGGAVDLATAGNAFDAAKAAFDMAKGDWDLAKAKGAKDDAKSDRIKTGESVVAVADVIVATGKGDAAAVAVGIAGFLGKDKAGTNNKDAIKKLKEANAATKAKAELAQQAGGPGAPGDGPRIVEIAPANIDREVGVDMTSIVGGEKTTKVDGDIKSTSGASHSMKAFNKIETASMIFDAYATIKATMKGLATAKVESLGIVTIDGKARVKVESKAKIAIEAPKIDVEGSVAWTLKTPKAKIDSPDVLIGTTKVKIDAKTEITQQLKVLGSIVGKKSCHLDESLEVKGGACIHKNLKVKKKIKNGSFSAS